VASQLIKKVLLLAYKINYNYSFISSTSNNLFRLRHATDESNKINKEIGVSTKDDDDKFKNYEKIKKNFDIVKVG
jgi:hypothetical protein